MKTILAVAVFVLVAFVAYKKLSGPSDQSTGRAAVDVALKVSEVDASVLEGMTEKMSSACARNKYGLSEQDCIQRIESRKNICLQETAHAFPGQIGNVERMQEVLSSHVECLLNKTTN